ncbi:hypothetical protein DPEC_G00102180 [Dallia pectoralis]|uniref:Uncharacterized protein n=1 Tax=Dallia pectoralis TaxID=75939 RepID=A0ACC2GWQ9_DALPE|nr:hypothetical protein DPEC_G00102180 [Dallia pectoralis]
MELSLDEQCVRNNRHGRRSIVKCTRRREEWPRRPPSHRATPICKVNGKRQPKPAGTNGRFSINNIA